jgi:hypothetical protein
MTAWNRLSPALALSLLCLPVLTNAQAIAPAPLSDSGTPSAAQPAPAAVQSTAAPANPDALEANPSRPSNSHSAELLAPGLLQAEYGFAREWERDSSIANGVGGELRFGVARALELRWGGNFLNFDQFPAASQHGFGDQLLTGEYHFKNQSERVPALAVSYTIKIPAANAALGLGTGRIDHSFAFLASKQLQKFICDVNVFYQVIGQTAGVGHDENEVVFLTVSHPLYGPLTLVSEIDAYTRLNPQYPAYASNLWALSYRVHRLVVLDASFTPGITARAPQKKIAFGLTYALANLYGRRSPSGQR